MRKRLCFQSYLCLSDADASGAHSLAQNGRLRQLRSRHTPECGTGRADLGIHIIMNGQDLSSQRVLPNFEPTI